MQQEFRKSRLTGRQIAVVEDEFLIAKDICEILASSGAEVLGPYSTVKRALSGLALASPAVALLDLNLGGHSSLPVAELLTARQIPFLVVTGYGPEMIKEELLRTSPTVAKPFDSEVLIARLLAVLNHLG